MVPLFQLVIGPRGQTTQQAVQIPRTLGVLRRSDLRRHGLAVLTALYRAEHANRGGRLTVVGEPADGKRNGRIGGGLVVHVQRVDTDLGDIDDLRRAVDDHHTPLAIHAEANRLTVREVDEHCVTGVLLGDRVERAIVEDVAVLEDFDDRTALVIMGSTEHLLHVTAIHVVRASDKGRLGAERHRDGVERLIDRTHRRGLGDLADLARRRVLAFGQSVDLVVEQQDRQIDVAAKRMDQMIAADRQHVAVAADDPHIEIRAGHGEAGRDRRRAAVNRVHPVGVPVVRETSGAADAGDEHGVLSTDFEFGHQQLHGGEDRVIPAAGAPANLLVARPVLLGGDRNGAHRATSWILVTSSAAVKG